MSIHQGYKIHFENHWGIFIGSFSDNIPHKHFATQVSITTTKKITIINEKKQSTQYEGCIIKNNVLHQFICESKHITLLIHPASSVGHYFNSLSSKNIDRFKNNFTDQLKKLAIDLLQEKIIWKDFINNIRALLDAARCTCIADNCFTDDRIKTAITYLEEHSAEIISLEKIATICYLSPSRFLHLFKEKTGISYRRLQLWNKISHSFSFLPKQSITATAHQFGFTDSAHYSRVFKETFGFSPKHLTKK